MTAKQKAARAKFKIAVAEAKKLRKKNPKLTQSQALKQAFAISYKKSKVGAVKKKTAPKKKAVTKKKAVAKKSGSYHKDTKSHNVNIRVISGTRSLIDIQRDIDDIKWLTKRIKEYQDTINYVKSIKPKDRTIMQKNALDRSLYSIKNLKIALTKVKKNIKL